MNADYFVYPNSKKVVEVWPPVNFVDLGGQLSFTNLTPDTIVVQKISHLINETPGPIAPGGSVVYNISNDANLKGGHAFTVKVNAMAVERGEEVQFEATAFRSGDPEIIIL